MFKLYTITFHNLNFSLKFGSIWILHPQIIKFHGVKSKHPQILGYKIQIT